jgi:hypothetical protein
MTRLAWAGLWLMLAGCAHAPLPAWSDDSRSDLAAQGTGIDPGKEPAPQGAPKAAPEATLIPAAAKAAPPAPVEDDAPMPADAPVVRLLDAGAEPRTRLRYRLAGPQTEDMTTTMNTTMATSFGPGMPAAEMATPAVRMLMSVTAAPAGKGELTSSMQVLQSDAVDAPGVLPGLAEKMGTELRKLVGMTVQSRLTTRGALIKAETSLPPDAPASARGTAESMEGSLGRSSVLPAEPVGVGARWETETQLHQNGMELRQTSRFRVRELAGTRVGLDLEIEVTGGAQEIKLPSGNGATAQLESLHGSGSGTLDLDLGSVVARRGHTDLDSQLAMRIPAAGQSLSVSTRMKMVMDLHAGR